MERPRLIIKAFESFTRGRSNTNSEEEGRIWQEFEQIKPQLEGKTILIIMDGNRRYAEERGWERKIGHKIGVENAKDLSRFLLSLKMNVVLWGFSTDNWKRAPSEAENIFKISNQALIDSIDEMDEKNVRVRHLGDKERLPSYLQETIANAEERTRGNTGPFFQIALSYSGRDEINRAGMNIAKKLANRELVITEDGKRLKDPTLEDREGKTLIELIKENSDDKGSAFEIDFVLRPGGVFRLSGFGIRAEFSEYSFSDKNFPEFITVDLVKALIELTKRDRRFGGDSKPQIE
ncbi:MAG: di-trans,poly-cis-decaprenylcistransferase [Candidatus Levybacteria bacterium RBG_16_35_11]|nr:MAG: di-trans,poly-cis-decaprenylcistransferase [Candidatus Levybacteria bacterium RBG_16_35_11]